MGHLSAEQKKFYKENGYIKLSNVFTPQEMDTIVKEYERLFELKNNQGMEAAWEGNDVKKIADKNAVIDFSVKSIHNLQYHSAVFGKILNNDKLLDALEDIMETKNILLHHTKAHFKPPEKGAPYPLHQDYHYFPFKKHSMVAAFLHIDDAIPENGGLCVYPGTHKLGPLEDKGLKTDVDHYHYVDAAKYPIEGATPITAKRGDIVVFSYLLLHGSYVNASTRPRRMFLVQLMSAEDEPVESMHHSPGQGWVLRGRNDKRDASMAKRFDQ